MASRSETVLLAPAFPVGINDCCPGRLLSADSVGAGPGSGHRRCRTPPRRIARAARAAFEYTAPAEGARKLRNWSRNGPSVTIKHVGNA